MKSTGIGPRSSPNALEKLRSRRRLANQNDKISKRSELSSQENWRQLKIAQLNEAEESQEDKRSNKRAT
jgi:hypothetical protein